MEEKFSFYWYFTTKNLYILVKGPCARAQSAPGLIRPYMDGRRKRNIDF